MSRGHKAVELMNDPVNRLPDDILNMIICKLDLKDAVKTSVLSKRWRHIWINHPDLHFDHFNILGFDYSQLKRNWVGVDTIFVNFVDQIMMQRFKGEDKINTFYLRFELGKSFSHSIDQWISYAVRKDVETIDLDFSRFPFNASRYSSFNQRFARYNFSLLRTTSENKGSLKHIRVACCNFMGRSSSKKFDSLVSLKLLKVNISDLQLRKVLECCSLLEELSLHNCSKLTYLSFGDLNNNTRLKILSLKNCLKLREIQLICAHHLISLELESINISDLQLAKFLEICPVLEELTLNSCSQLMYLRINNSNGSCMKILSLNSCSNLMETHLRAKNLHTLSFTSEKGSFYFQGTPNLVNVFIGENINGMHPFSLLEFETPVIKNLILPPYHDLYDSVIPSNLMTVFPNVQRLVLSCSPFHNDDELLWVEFILRCFPLLETLELNLCSPTIKRAKDRENVLDKCPNRCITKLVLNGFVGKLHEVVLLMYLLENLPGLRVLAIGPSEKVYNGFNSWVNEEASIWGKRWFQIHSNWLRSITPSFVRIEFLESQSPS